MDGKELIGIASAALGLSSCFDAPFRLYKRVSCSLDCVLHGLLLTEEW